MDDAPSNPFHGGIIDSGLMLVPPVILGILYFIPTRHGISGHLVTTYIVVGPLPASGGPTLATVVSTIPPFMYGEIVPSTTILSIPTIPLSTPIFRSHPYPPPFTHRNCIPAGIGSIVGPSHQGSF